MRMEEGLSCYFDQFAQNYAATQRLSPSCAMAIVKEILKETSLDNLSIYMDIGCGDAFLSSLLLGNSESKQCILIDISNAMLERARQRLSCLRNRDNLLFVRADAGAIPLRSDSTKCVLMAFLLHLIQNPDLVLHEVIQILSPGGRFFLVTYDPDDLASHIYDIYFPGYREIDLQRFKTISQLLKLLEGCGYTNIAISKYPYEIRFKNVDDVIHLVKKKPHSTFEFYTNKVFADSLKKFEFNLRLQFGQGEVIYGSKVTLLSMMKAPS